MKYIMIAFITFLLISCDGGGSSPTILGGGESSNTGPDGGVDSTGTETGDMVAGQLLYKSAEQGCLTCHGVDGQSPNIINLNANTYSQDGEEHTLAAYIELFMPFADPATCDSECATDIAAYLRTLAQETVTPPIAASELFSVVTRLTNDEYYSVLGDLVELSDERQAILKETVELSAEFEHAGLVNAADRQQLSQIVVSGFLSAATEAANLRLRGGGVNPLSVDRFNAFILCSDPSMSHNDCIRDRGVSYIEKGFRGQATASDIDALDELLAAFDNLQLEADELELLVLRYQAVVQFVALSPKFSTIYEIGIADEETNSERPLTGVEIANRLSFFIAGTRPDEELEIAAADGLLNASDGRRNQALRLAVDQESSTGVEKIVASWLGFNPDLTNAESITETETFIEAWIQDRRPFSDLYTSIVAVNNAPVDGQGASVSQEPFGVLGLQGVVASHTNHPVASFINRGEFIVEDLLCGILPEDIPDAALEGESETALEIFEGHSKQPCATCHKIFDNYGAAMQRFDGEESLYNPQDDWLGTNFELFPVGDVSGTVSNPADLGQIMGASRQAHTCFANLWYRHAMRRDLLEADTSADKVVINTIVDEWIDGDSSVILLLELISGHETFAKLYR